MGDGKTDKEVVRELKELGYKYACKCLVCKKFYGSDFERDNGVCPKCRNKPEAKNLKKKGRGLKNNAK
jgi:hypothetical protein